MIRLGLMLFLLTGPLIAQEQQLRSGQATPKEREFWSFQPITNPAPPLTKNPGWEKNAIDKFILSKLELAGVKPAPKAEKRVLLRRVSFSLTGLPPSQEMAEKFLNDQSPDAYSRLIKELLASRAYGEHWGRHWLDVVRYADTAGETADYPVPEAYLYRDWVVQAFNEDIPYDRFLTEQLAGDLLAEEFGKKHPAPLNAEQAKQYSSLVQATGFIALSRRFGFDPENYHDLTIQDTLDTMGQAVLGLSLGCCHCHDHKYDPLSRSDYYGWFGIFESTRYAYPGSEFSKKRRDFASALPKKEVVEKEKKRTGEMEKISTEMKRLEDEKTLLLKSTPASPRMKEIEEKKNSLALKKGELGQASLYPLVYGVSDDKGQDSKLRIRGEANRFGKETPRRNLEIFGGEPLRVPGESGRRELAQWLTKKENPLTARVMVNRIWHYHFGRGLVETPNDFGTRGKAPTHPELLDWLASRFISSGWSVKAIHWVILNSATYQSASGNFSNQSDPENQLLSRFSPRRLTAEEIRDSLLFVSGTLDSVPGGPHPFPKPEQWNFTQHNPFQSLYETRKRSLYLMQPRLKRHPFLALFDGADPNASTAKRNTTTVPTQALFFMNDPFVLECSRALGKRMIAGGKEPGQKVRQGFLHAYTRQPSEGELASSLEFLAAYKAGLPQNMNEKEKEEAAYSSLARSLFSRNEFLYLE